MQSLEDLKAVACAVQASAAVALDRSERDRQAVEGVPARRRGVGVAAQVGLARRESPYRGSILLGAAKVWAAEMPHTFAALRHGRVSEYQAILRVQETACLELEDRARVDALLCSDPATLKGVGVRQMAAMARRHAAQLDPGAVVRRARRAESERCVTLRPAPDSMSYLTTLLPVAQGVAAYAALCRAADLSVATGGVGADDAPRGRGQIMADALVERVTGQATASAVPVTVNLVISDAALLGAGHEPAHLQGAGPIPAQVARALTAAGIDADSAWLRRPYVGPGGDLVAMTSKSRFHPEGLAEFLRIRDQGICRTPYCGAPIRHIDHIIGVASGGATSADNGEGLCVACNLGKEAPGWKRRTVPGREVRDGEEWDGDKRDRGAHDLGVGDRDQVDPPWPAGGVSARSSGADDDGRAPEARDARDALSVDDTESGGRAHVIETTTPTGHVYRRRARPLPRPALRIPPARRARRGTASHSVVDVCLGALVAEHIEFAA